MEKFYKKVQKTQKNHDKINKSDDFLKKNDKNCVGDINFKKSLGQNFLFDTNLLKAIVKDGLVEKDDTVLEIGAGAGTLTEQIALVAKNVKSFEIDKSLKQRLDEIATRHNNIQFFFMDFMDADVENLFEGQARVVANIPYYITTPIVFKLVEHIKKFKSILVLVQKEVAERFASKNDTKEYGITSVILQSIFDVTIPRIVKKECFTPAPKIDSALCLLVPHDKYNISDFESFKKFVHQSFSMRRKTLINNLKSFCDKQKLISELSSLGYSETTRPEQIKIKHFVELFEKLK